MSIQSELEAIQHAAAIYPVTDRSFLRITGSDATRWLNGMVTNNIKDLAQSKGNYNFLLNAQGRILGDCTIFREPADEPTFLLETDTSQIEAIQQHLDKFIIMDDVELALVENQQGIFVLGPQALSLVMALGTGNQQAAPCSPNAQAPAPQSLNLKRTMYGGNPVSLILRNGPDVPGFEIWSDPATSTSILTELRDAQTVEVSPEAQEAHRILSATPRYGQDIRNTETAKDLPQETALNGGTSQALHFSKGCYLGQEIVERIHSRGQVHRTFTQFHLTGDLPQLPTPLEATALSPGVPAKPAGELTSAIQIGDQKIALGYLRREFQNQPLTHPGGTATPTTASKNPETNKLEASS